METEGTSILQSGVLLIPLLLFATLAILFVLVQRWRSQTTVDFKTLRAELRQMHFNQREIIQVIQHHSPDDPEPYGSRIRRLHSKIHDTQETLRRLEARQVVLQEQAHWLNQNSFQALVGGPYFWYQLRREIKDFQVEIEKAWQALGGVIEFVQQIDRLGLQVAQKAHQVTQIQQQTNQVMDQLRSRGMLGKTIASATQQEKQAKASLGQIPLYFLEGDENAIREKADKENTISAHTILESVQQSLQALLAQATGWDEQYNRASESAASMDRTLTSLEQLISQAPGELDITQRRAQFSQLKTAAQNLDDRLKRVEVEQIESLAQEAAQITHEAQAAESELKQAYESAARLGNELSELSNGLKNITLIIASLGTKAHYPVAWGQSSDRLADLNRQNTAIGPAKKPRDAMQMIQDLEKAVRLNEQQRELGLRLRQMEEQHTELTQIIASPEISQINAWLKDAQQLTDKVKGYAPENWPRLDAVSELPAEMQSVANDVLRVLPPGNVQSIPEAELPGRLEDARRLQQAYQRLQKRIENIRNQLTNLQKEEKQIQGQMTSAQTTVTQVSLIIRSNPLLPQIATQDNGRFQLEMQSVVDDLANRQHGTLDKKVKAGLAVLGKIEQSANRWLDQMNQDTQQQVQTLTKMLNALDAIAPIEEQPVNDARRLLSSGAAFSGGVSPGGGFTPTSGSYASKSKFRLEDLTPEFKRRSDFWQSCAGVSRGLEEVGVTVLDSYGEADHNRQQAHEMLTQVAAWLRQSHDWPPSSVSLDAERQEMDRIDGQWQAIKPTPTRAIQLVQQLGQLSARYHELAVRIQQTSERADQEMAAVETLENEIIDLEGRWQNNWSNYQDDPQVTADIRRLLDEIEREMSNLKRQYKQKRNYVQVLQSLKTLERKARAYQVELDENRALDVDGNERRRR